jgi:hypothetical protein
MPTALKHRRITQIEECRRPDVELDDLQRGGAGLLGAIIAARTQSTDELRYNVDSCGLEYRPAERDPASA